MLTYGDGLADIDLAALLRFHHEGRRRAAIAVASTDPSR